MSLSSTKYTGHSNGGGSVRRGGSAVKRSGGGLKPTTAMPTKSQRRAGVRSGQKGALASPKGTVRRKGY